MSALQTLRDKIGEFARDTRINLGSVLQPSGAPGLSESQIYGVALACAFSIGNKSLLNAVVEEASTILTDEQRQAAKSAASIMAMNNIYYRFLHLSGDSEIKKLPAKLRMNVIGNPGIEKVDFELYSLAVSALAGCGSCVTSHINEVRKGGISNEGIQSSVRIASVLNAAAVSLEIQD